MIQEGWDHHRPGVIAIACHHCARDREERDKGKSERPGLGNCVWFRFTVSLGFTRIFVYQGFSMLRSSQMVLIVE